MPAHELRGYQSRGIEAARVARRCGHRRIILQAPTGSGKTVIAVAMIMSAIAKGARVLVIAHRKELIDQFYSQLYRAGIVAGVMRAKDQRTDKSAPVQLGTIQTLQRRELPPADIVFVDECHRCPGDSYKRILERFPDATIIGLTATPARLDGKPLSEHFDELVPVARYSELIESGAIVAPVVYGPPGPDLSRVKKVAGDFDAGQLEEVMKGAHVVGDVVRTWHIRAEDRSTVVFCVGIEHSRRLVERFLESGVAAAHLDGTTPEDEREQILLDLEMRRTRVVCNVGVLCEGWDQPSVKCCVMARPTLSLTLWMQCSGRILRPWGAQPPLLLDHSGNVDRHGLPHEDREWSLTGKVKRSRPLGPMLCANCFAYTYTMPCELCGWQQPAAPRVLKECEGELVRVDHPERREATGDERLDFYNLQAENARRKGFKPGFAAAKFKEKWGEWPPWAWSQKLKQEFDDDPFWKERLAKRERERAFWQDRQAAAKQLEHDAAQYEPDEGFTEEPETFTVEDL